MPTYPDTSRAVSEIRGSIFTALAEKLRAFQGEVYPLHVGDTWLEPVEGARMEDLRIAELPGMHRYSQPEGLPRLVDLLAARATATTGVEHERRSVLVTTGATGALGAILGALLHPGDEVLLLAPYWPLIEGIVRAFHGVPVDVPFFGHAESAETAIECLEPHLHERTAAIYLNTPNNPTGRVIPRPWLEAIVEWAQRHRLWIVADEVYEDLVYDGEHTWCRSLACDRTFSAHSFSKGWAMAGNRCGWVLGPARHMAELRKVGTHTFYAAPTASQLAGCRLLEGDRARAWLEAARTMYRELGGYAAARLGVEPPAGSTFLFLDVAPALDERGLAGFLLDCGERGVFVAPGPSFGPYPTHIRICFTAAPPEVTRRGIDVLAGLLGRSAVAP
ncbi:MAG TPA: pyridoxal phosphate-dependent aminotransferase [Thermoanaerobaculia bacterium]|nr:pyridoxal phosphate-dependent aminotransferase [Thermoanaerobaculia bacterium]